MTARSLDGFEFVRVIGKGNFGQALLVRERGGTRRELVIKQITVGGVTEGEAMREVRWQFLSLPAAC